MPTPYAWIDLAIRSFSVLMPRVGSPWIIAIGVLIGTFVHEDLATIGAALMVANGTTNAAVALPALYIGIVAGDIGLYGIGRLAAARRLSMRFINRDDLAASKTWLEKRVIAGVFVVRFLPGLRFSAYTAYGFFAMPFGRFAISVLLAASIWTTGLFYLAIEFGPVIERSLGAWRWASVIIGGLVPVYLAVRLTRRNSKSRRPTAPADDN